MRARSSGVQLAAFAFCGIPESEGSPPATYRDGSERVALKPGGLTGRS